MRKKDKPAKWHMCFHTGPRINIQKIDAFDTVIASYNNDIVFRANNLEPRKIPVMMIKKDHELLRYNLSTISNLDKFPKWEDIHLFGDGYHIAVLRHPDYDKEIQKQKDRVKQDIEDEINQKIANGEVKQKQD